MIYSFIITLLFLSYSITLLVKPNIKTKTDIKLIRFSINIHILNNKWKAPSNKFYDLCFCSIATFILTFETFLRKAETWPNSPYCAHKWSNVLLGKFDFLRIFKNNNIVPTYFFNWNKIYLSLYILNLNNISLQTITFC